MNPDLKSRIYMKNIRLRLVTLSKGWWRNIACILTTLIVFQSVISLVFRPLNYLHDFFMHFWLISGIWVTFYVCSYLCDDFKNLKPEDKTKEEPFTFVEDEKKTLTIVLKGVIVALIMATNIFWIIYTYFQYTNPKVGYHPIDLFLIVSNLFTYPIILCFASIAAIFIVQSSYDISKIYVKKSKTLNYYEIQTGVLRDAGNYIRKATVGPMLVSLVVGLIGLLYLFGFQDQLNALGLFIVSITLTGSMGYSLIISSKNIHKITAEQIECIRQELQPFLKDFNNVDSFKSALKVFNILNEDKNWPFNSKMIATNIVSILSSIATLTIGLISVYI